MGQTGAGHPAEELDDDRTEISLVNNVVQGQDLDIRHDSIPTADHEEPLMSPEHLTLFADCLAALQSDNQGDLLRLVSGGPFVWDLLEPPQRRSPAARGFVEMPRKPPKQQQGSNRGWSKGRRDREWRSAG